MSVHARKDYIGDDGRWVCVFKNEKGKRQEKSFGRGEQAHLEALAFDSAMKAKFEAANPNPAANLTYTLEDVANDYLRMLMANQRSPKTLKCVKSVLTNVVIPYFGATLPAAMISSLQQIQDFMLALRNKISKPSKQPLKASTINGYCQILQAALRHAQRFGHIPEDINPFQGWKPLKEKKREFEMTLEDAQCLLAHADPYIALGLKLAYMTGIRTGDSELLHLQWKNIDWENCELNVYSTKTNTSRKIPLSPDYIDELKAHYEFEKTCYGKALADEHYLIEKNGKPVTYSIFLHGFHKALRKAGILKHLVPYDFRHFSCSTMLSNGADLMSVSKILGHLRLSTTIGYYYHYIQGGKRKAIQMLTPLGTTLNQTAGGEPNGTQN